MHAAEPETVNPNGDGVRMGLDLRLARDLAVRVAGAHAKLRHIAPYDVLSLALPWSISSSDSRRVGEYQI